MNPPMVLARAFSHDPPVGLQPEAPMRIIHLDKPDAGVRLDDVDGAVADALRIHGQAECLASRTVPRLVPLTPDSDVAYVSEEDGSDLYCTRPEHHAGDHACLDRSTGDAVRWSQEPK